MKTRPLALLPLLASLCAFAPSCGSSDDAPNNTSASEKDWKAESERLLDSPDWYRHAVFYEVFIKSFQDSDGDGSGDIQGLISRLDYLKDLGVDALWLMPVMKSPFKDSGYDISDYNAINPDYGSMADFEQLLAEAHKRKMRVMIDMVLNHTSDQHAWFQSSRSSKDDPKADWYVWSDTPSPPDNPCKPQQPIFGDSSWTYDEGRGQYYFHRFYPSQPDLNYRNPAVVDATLSMADFWLQKGVDGFRCDVIALLYESAAGCDLIDETKEYIRKLRGVVDKYPGAVMVAESSDFGDSSAYFGDGSDMFHMAFNFAFGYFWGLQFGGETDSKFIADFSAAINKYPAGAQDALVIGSHDVGRAFSSAQSKPWRALRAFDITATMRGTPFIYYGDELMMRPTSDKVVDSRDAQRAPMPWTAADGHGFTTGKPWLDFSKDASETSVEREQTDPSSTLSYYKQLLALRRGHAVWGTGSVRLLTTDSEKVFAYVRENEDEAYAVAINMTDEPQQTEAADARLLAPGAVVWGAGSLSINGERATISLPAESSAIFKLRLGRWRETREGTRDLSRLASRRLAGRRIVGSMTAQRDERWQPSEVVSFWRDAGPQAWFTKNQSFDAALKQRFLAQHEAAASRLLDDWAQSAEGALALMILLDQFPRNAFRNSVRMYETDALALAYADDAIARGLDSQTDKSLRLFFYLPFMHAEDLAHQERCVSLCASLGETKHAIEHRDVIARFGRFPHRNPILGRAMTSEEQAFLDAGGFAG